MICLTDESVIVKILTFFLCLLSFFVAIPRPKPKARKNAVPECAVKVKVPNSDSIYMSLWRRNGRVCMVFGNMPNVTIMFDEKVAGELSSSLGEIETWPSC